MKSSLGNEIEVQNKNNETQHAAHTHTYISKRIGREKKRIKRRKKAARKFPARRESGKEKQRHIAETVERQRVAQKRIVFVSSTKGMQKKESVERYAKQGERGTYFLSRSRFFFKCKIEKRYICNANVYSRHLYRRKSRRATQTFQ